MEQALRVRHADRAPDPAPPHPSLPLLAGELAFVCCSSAEESSEFGRQVQSSCGAWDLNPESRAITRDCHPLDSFPDSQAVRVQLQHIGLKQSDFDQATHLELKLRKS